MNIEEIIENLKDLENEQNDYASQGNNYIITKDNAGLVIINFLYFFVIVLILEISNILIIYRILLLIIITIVFFILLFIFITIKNKSIFVNTEFGKCKCKLRKYNWDNYQLWIYYEKLTNQNKENKYSKLMIIYGYKIEMTNIYNQMKTQPYKRYSLESIIKKFNLKTKFINLGHAKDKININKSNVAKLGELPFIDKENAVKIVMHIQKNGEFESIWDFAEFINLSQEQVNLLLKYAYVEKTDLKEEVFKIEENNLKGDDPGLDI